jgi:hypothetical protein
MSTSTVRTVCGSSARTDLCGGRSAMTVPTAIDTKPLDFIIDATSHLKYKSAHPLGNPGVAV